jgi:hypothetical protein
MPERDLFHDAVKNALVKDNWTITHDPLIIQFGVVQMFVDLGAEKIIAAEKAGRKIAVEVKSFVSLSPISEFHTALGQFLNYQVALEEQQPERTLYLAVPLDTYRAFFILPFTQAVVQRYRLKLIVYNVVEEVIVRWHE